MSNVSLKSRWATSSSLPSSIMKESNQFCWDSLSLVNLCWLFPGTLLFLFLGIPSRIVFSIIFLETEDRPAVPGIQGFSLFKKKKIFFPYCNLKELLRSQWPCKEIESSLLSSLGSTPWGSTGCVCLLCLRGPCLSLPLLWIMLFPHLPPQSLP